MIRNGFNSSGRSRLRCKKCGTSTTATNDSAVQTARFKIFTDWILSSNSLTTIAADNKKSRRQITRWFETFWLVHVPNNIDPNRVFDQVFIDGTYFGHNNCLLVASSKTHVIAWRWCQRESTANYRRLLDQIPHPPLVATIDGHHGLLKALKDHWPTTKVQRCLVHIKRNIQQEVGLYPRHTTGKILRELSLSLLKVSTTEEAAQWSARLQEFSQLYGRYLNERTFIEDIQPADIPQRFRRNKNGSTRTTGTDQPGKISPTATKNKHYLRSSPARTMHVPSSYLGKQTVSKAESTPWSKTSPVITVA